MGILFHLNAKHSLNHQEDKTEMNSGRSSLGLKILSHHILIFLLVTSLPGSSLTGSRLKTNLSLILFRFTLLLASTIPGSHLTTLRHNFTFLRNNKTLR